MYKFITKNPLPSASNLSSNSISLHAPTYTNMSIGRIMVFLKIEGLTLTFANPLYVLLVEAIIQIKK